MAATYNEHGVTFQYPGNWALERDEYPGGWSVTIQSPATAFLTVSFHDGDVEFGRLADEAVEALRAEYPGLESEPVTDTIAKQPAVGHDVRFFSMDLTNTAWVRALPVEGGSLVVLGQVNDLELDRNGQVLRAICASMSIDE